MTVFVRPSAFGLLAVANAIFLWMFLSTDPLEQLAMAAASGREAQTRAALAFAAAWRHGMAGNSFIFMPGFFATAAALWLHAHSVPSREALADRVGAGALALVIAFAASPATATDLVRSFDDRSTVRFVDAVPGASIGGTCNGLYTLLTWSTFVVACRTALLRRNVRPFVLPAVLTVGLVLLRPRTVDDFTTHWVNGVANGDLAACVSFALVFVLGALLAASERTSAKPQPRKAALQRADAPRKEDEQQVGRRGNQIETR